LPAVGRAARRILVAVGQFGQTYKLALADASASKVEVAAIDLNRHPKQDASFTLKAEHAHEIVGETATRRAVSGSTRVSRVGFGVSPKQSSES
jgi:hypothetical protein